MNINDRELLARTLQAEAGNQGYGGMLAAGSVIMNRANTSGYGNGLRGVILKPGQFSAWNSTTGYAGGEQGQDMANMLASDEAYKAADDLISGGYKDVTGGATHYYNPAISQPKWGQKAGGDWKQIGDHVFGFADAGRSPNPNQAIASDAMRVLGKQPKGLLASSTMNTTESEMVPEQKPKGLLGGLFSDPDKRARLAMALEGMTLNPNKGMMASLQSGIQQRGEDKKEAAAEAKQLAKTNKSLELLAGLPGGQEFVRIAEIAGPKAGVQAYFESKKAPKSTAAQDKIARLISTGVPESIAIGMTDGRLVARQNDVTGETFVFDVATGQKVFDATGASGNEVPIDQPASITDKGSLSGLDPTKALAARGYANSWLNAAADTFGQKLPAPEAAKASAAMRSLATRTIALADTEFAGKPTNFLRERVEQNFSINPDQISMGPRVALDRSNVIIDMLQETVDGAKAVIAGKTATVDAKKSAMDSLPKSEALLRDYISLRDALNSNLGNGNNPAQIPKDVMTIYEQYTSEAN